MTDDQLATQELKPCPHEECDGAGEVQYHCGVYYVECLKCEGQGPMQWLETSAITEWNAMSRLTHSPASDVGDRLGALQPQNCLVPAPQGDCFRACVATITGIDAATMPNFMHTGTKNGLEGAIVARDWLNERGLTIFNTWAEGTRSLESVLKVYSAENPGAPFILSGRAAHVDDYHSVVVLDGRIAHDPSGAGISGPCPCVCGEEGCEQTSWPMDVIVPMSLAALRSQPAGCVLGGRQVTRAGFRAKLSSRRCRKQAPPRQDFT